MADQPTVPFQTREGHTVTMQQPQRGAPSNRVIPTSAHQVDSTPTEAPPEDSDDRMVVRWAPLRSDPIAVARLELTDCIFVGLPPSPAQEQNQESRVALGLLTEIIALRARVAALEGGGAAEEPESA